MQINGFVFNFMAYESQTEVDEKNSRAMRMQRSGIANHVARRQIAVNYVGVVEFRNVDSNFHADFFLFFQLEFIQEIRKFSSVDKFKNYLFFVFVSLYYFWNRNNFGRFF